MTWVTNFGRRYPLPTRKRSRYHNCGVASVRSILLPIESDGDVFSRCVIFSLATQMSEAFCLCRGGGNGKIAAQAAATQTGWLCGLCRDRGSGKNQAKTVVTQTCKVFGLCRGRGSGERGASGGKRVAGGGAATGCNGYRRRGRRPGRCSGRRPSAGGCGAGRQSQWKDPGTGGLRCSGASG